MSLDMLTQNEEFRSQPLRKVFVTVGSTSFDELIITINNQSCLAAMHSRGVEEIKVQYGNGKVLPRTSYKEKLKMESFQYKSSIVEEFNWADLVISHGGAGSVLESLRAKKKLIIVVNKKLMDNHQLELAEAMTRNGYAILASTESLVETIKNVVSRPLKFVFLTL
ncbi:beta-1,4-N-acetylglucosaminyltransferase [Galdieria sulphuraria]|uniref:UDP-N-acetylglucosamine transferase subunit ALG13 n=1 Tax=Galdieria sulphuraria TaxID=130081 RepID=M2XG73_GALSU|nr:beta-1,4-N-acetylglucosaminyltransferase [Galdieria sulphuraria]EME29042.1 beta-1,4-N-acetylglucosaminyltransferase [Galdieria sulphuraria]|eukprot:XP_005705562.1 beta-1,4-N-acetylglucosaminyltransferase [Galdieria sulphuraria]